MTSFSQLRGLLSSFPQAVGELMDEFGEPEEDSSAAEERLAAGELAKAAHVQAQLFVTIVADHMAALQRELREPVMTFAPWTTARCALEASATAMWLLDEVDLKTRLSRSFTLRLRHLRDEMTYVRDSLQHHPEIRDFGEAVPYICARIAHLRTEADRFDIQEKLDRRERLLAFGEAMPSTTTLADRYLDEGGTYRLLSAAAHGRFWASLALGLSVKQMGGQPVVEQSLTLGGATFLAISTIDWFAKPVWAYFQLNGWKLDRLIAVLEGTYNQAELHERTRFWRATPGR